MQKLPKLGRASRKVRSYGEYLYNLLIAHDNMKEHHNEKGESLPVKKCDDDGNYLPTVAYCPGC